MREIQWTDEKAARLWGYYATSPAYQNQYFSFHSGKSILDYVRQHVDIGKMGSILDFGCGPGYMIGHLMDISAGNCYGLDFSKESVEQVNRRFKGRPGFGDAIFVKTLPSSYKDASMNLVISVEVVEHLDNPQLAGMLQEIHRLLKRDGYIVITTPNREDLNANKTICPECECVFHRWQHVRNWNKDELTKALQHNGFKSVHVGETCFRPPSSSVVDLDYLKQILNSALLRRRQNLVKPHLIYIGRRS